MKRTDDDESLFGFGRAVLNRLDRVIELLEVLTEDRERNSEGERDPPEGEGSDGTVEQYVYREALAPKGGTSTKKLRGISPEAFRLCGSKVLAALLAEKSDVGKLTISLERENDIRSNMLAIVLRILQEEGVLRVSDGPRGQARYVRLVNAKLAEERLETLKAEMREEAKSRLKELGE